ANEALVRSRVRDREAVLRDRVHLRQHEEQERAGEQEQGAEPRRRVDARDGPGGGRPERDRAAGPRAVEQRHQERPGHREWRDREREERRPPHLGLGRRDLEEHGLRERDRHHRVAGHAAEVREPVGVEWVLRAPHAPERPEQRLDHRDEPEQDELPPRVAFRRPPIDPHRLPDQDPDSRWRSSSRTALGLAEPPDFFITCPRTALSAPSLPPRNCSTGPGFSAIASSTQGSGPEASPTWRRPRRSTIAPAASPVSNASSSTCFAPVAETVSSATSATRSATCRGVTLAAASSILAVLTNPARS